MVIVKAPGSCGELVQGTINGENFLVTCPVNLYSEVTITPSSRLTIRGGGEKIRKAVNNTLQYLNIRAMNQDLYITTELPIGKGMASSSADISAACQAIALSKGKLLSPDELADIALSIEPTDAIFYPGIFMFDHVHGRIRKFLGKPPDIHIAIFDVGGKIDTCSFNRRSNLQALNSKKEKKIRLALELVSQGVKNSDAKMIGEGATISALANQTILFKPSLEGIIEISKQFKAVGVNIAHSGTVIGVLFASRDTNHAPLCATAISTAFPDVQYLRTVKIVSGGLQIWEGDTHTWSECF